MKLSTTIGVGLISSVFALGIATAADNDGMMMGQKHEMGKDGSDMGKGHAQMDPVARAKEQLSELKAKLNLTKEQEPALQTFSDQVTEQAKIMMSMQEKMKSAMPKAAPDQMAMMADAMKSRAQNMATMSDAVKKFYGVLNPEQQATFDKIHTSHMMSAMHE